MSNPKLLFLYPILWRPLEFSRAAQRISVRTRSVRRPKRFTTSSRQQQAPETGGQRYGTAQEPPEQKQKEDTTAAQKDDATESAPSASPPDPLRIASVNPLETVLHMPSPAEEESQKPPHLKTPRYVHHFDTYGLVQDLAKSGSFSPEQAVTIMKALRGILIENMELARAGLVSKSDVENETYLFRAACSELRTEISNNRKGETEKMRTERNQLQHEVDILSQRLTQESLSLKDDLKGLFDDRKMTVRMEQRSMESKIQELNYKITVALNSDARSEIEGLRWVLTRRAAIAIGVSALMLFAMLRYSSYVTRTQAEEKKKAKKIKESMAKLDEPPNSNLKAQNASEKDDSLSGEILLGEGGVSLG
ncbi:hypothetical protein GQ43DRAFT_446785 [Delitschia confertaspora ATCC 74209]|uniref:MOZ protein represents a chromatin-associated acetyltransferase n=1 Tax=Delitschia confertaspora ATCC 74209 TaxID=1513339 RepID=A0A9P4JTY1_9PLEO|nr:hypothetical protein GQ43DRAFT_446785 [Delitschia confertaspora ATCC 74209]